LTILTCKQETHEPAQTTTASCLTPCALQDPYRSQLESLLSSQVLPLFQSPHGHLRAKAAWLAKEFADVHSGSGPLFNALLQAVINGLNDRWAVEGFVTLQA
jgi:hypothetical protein